MSSSGLLVEKKKQPPPWVRRSQLLIGLFKLALGVASLLYLVLCLRHCSQHYLAWFIMFTVVASLDGGEMLLSRCLHHFPGGRSKACIGCLILWTSWSLSFSYIAMLIWGSITLSWDSHCEDTGVRGVMITLVVLCGLHSLYTFFFSCLPICCICCPLLSAITSTGQPAKEQSTNST